MARMSASGSSDETEVFVPPNSEALVLNTEILLSDVGTLAAWLDTSGAGNDMTQATAGFRPTTTGGLHSNGLWYGPVFDQTDDEFSAGGPTLSGNYRAFALAWNQPNTDGGVIAGGTANHQIFFGGDFRPAGATTYTFDTAPIALGEHIIFVYVDYVNDTVEIWYDGIKVIDATNFTDAPSSRPFRAWHSNFAYQARTMFRMLAWDSASPLTWTAGDIADINGHLAGGS